MAHKHLLWLTTFNCISLTLNFQTPSLNSASSCHPHFPGARNCTAELHLRPCLCFFWSCGVFCAHSFCSQHQEALMALPSFETSEGCGGNYLEQTPEWLKGFGNGATFFSLPRLMRTQLPGLKELLKHKRLINTSIREEWHGRENTEDGLRARAL